VTAQGERATTRPLALVEERIDIRKEKILTGRVSVRKRARAVVVELPAVSLVRERATVERISVGRFVDEEPVPRVEGDVVVVPLVDEVLVKRLFLREEIRIRRIRSTEQSAPQVATLRLDEAFVEREVLDADVEPRRDRGGGPGERSARPPAEASRARSAPIGMPVSEGASDEDRDRIF
jgi:stress response protein YsnF